MTQGHLKSIRIRNFQAHADTVLELVPGVNGITGENGVGKSVVFRALMAAAYFGKMRPRYDEDETSVTLSFEEGDVERILKRKKGVYESQHYVFRGKSHRKGLNPVIEEFMNMSPVILGKTEKVFLNIREQHDPAFMISPEYSEPFRMRMLGCFGEQQDVDASAKEAQKNQQRLKSEIETLNGLYLQSLEEVKALDKEPNLSEMADRLSTQMDEILALKAEFDRIEEMRNRLLTAKASVDEVRVTTSMLEQFDIDGLEERFLEIGELTAQLEIQELLHSRLVSVREELDEIRSLEFPDVDSLQQKAVDIADMAKTLAQMEALERSHDIQADILRSILETKQATSDLDRMIEELISIEDLVEQLSQMEKLMAAIDLNLKSKNEATQALEASQAEEAELRATIDHSGICPFWDQVEFQDRCKTEYLKV